MRRPIAALAVLAIGAAAALTACGSDAPRQQAYCTTQDGRVVDPHYCDSGYSGSDALLYLYLMGAFGGHSYRPGMVIQNTYVHNSVHVNPHDPAARARAGLPRTGTVRTGQTVKPPAKPSSASRNTGGSSRPSSGSGGSRNTGGSRPGGSVNRPQPAPRPAPAPPPAPAPRPPAPPHR